MCVTGEPIETARVARCQHGCFHLTLGRQTLHLTTPELLMLAQSINRYVHRNPAVLSEVDEDEWRRIEGRNFG